MPRYHTIKGVVLTSICGEFSLVCATALRKSLPPVAQLNESSAFLWRLLESGADKGELEKAVMAEYEIDDAEEARSAINAFLDQMLQAGYLIEEGGNNEK